MKIVDDSTDASQGANTEDGSRAAVRLLEAAARNAEELLAEVKTEAAQLRASVREEVDRLRTEAEADAQRIRDDLENTRAQLNAEIARLQKIERDLRDQLRRHLSDLLAVVEAGPRTGIEDR